MKTNRFIRMMLVVIMTLALTQAALAEMAAEPVKTPSVETLKTETAFGAVSYPALSGYADELTQVNVNLMLLERGKVLENIDTLMKQGASGWGMDESFEAMLESDLLSVVFSMRGDLKNNATEQCYETLNYDLLNKREIALTDIFTDVQAAQEQMETIMLDTVAPMLSGYVVNEEVTPLPLDKFSLTKDGVTFHYEDEQFMMISGYAGSASFFYYELAPYLNLESGSVLDRLGVGKTLDAQADAKDRIAAIAAEGTLPGIPFKLNDRLKNIFDTYRLFSDPDYFPGGRFFQLEAGEFRGITLLSDTERRDYAETPLLGIRCDRMNLYGVKVGETTLDEWRALLGTPDDTVELDAYTAQDFLLPAGTSDYYLFGAYRLRLHADEAGVLTSLFLTT